jgi:hypothetical protein
MPKPRPWWETHPKKYWQAEDSRAARAAGVVPPQPSSGYVDPLSKLLAQTGPPAPSLSGGLYGDDQARRATERRRKVDQLLEAAGVRPRKTW